MYQAEGRGKGGTSDPGELLWGLSQVRDEKMPQKRAAYPHVPRAQVLRTAWTGTKLMQGQGLENE